MLRRLARWTGFVFGAPVIALVVPGVDGDYAMLAAESEERLSEILRPLAQSFVEAGFHLNNDEA